MRRLLLINLVVSTLTVSFLASDRAVAAPITVFHPEVEALFELESTTETGAGKTAKPKRQKPAPLPLPEPNDGPVADGLTGGLMSPQSLPSTSVGSSAAPADVTRSASLSQCQLSMAIRTDEWLFIPPRFLDGIFRPPKSVVSL